MFVVLTPQFLCAVLLTPHTVSVRCWRYSSEASLPYHCPTGQSHDSTFSLFSLFVRVQCPISNTLTLFSLYNRTLFLTLRSCGLMLLGQGAWEFNPPLPPPSLLSLSLSPSCEPCTVVSLKGFHETTPSGMETPELPWQLLLVHTHFHLHIYLCSSISILYYKTDNDTLCDSECYY